MMFRRRILADKDLQMKIIISCGLMWVMCSLNATIL